MKRVGVRELRQQASRYLDLVKAGETIEVTERGRPIAHLTPLPVVRKNRLEELTERGDARPATASFAALGPPLPSRPRRKPLSEQLREQRDSERF